MIHALTINVTFGDCDPAGIVYYPNMFRWMDATFHDYLKAFGGHASLCKKLGAKGMGLAGTDTKFRYPVTDGDTLSVEIAKLDWSDRTFTLHYEGRVGARVVFFGSETRCLFIPGEDGFHAGPVEDAKRLMEHGGR